MNELNHALRLAMGCVRAVGIYMFANEALFSDLNPSFVSMVIGMVLMLMPTPRFGPPQLPPPKPTWADKQEELLREAYAHDLITLETYELEWDRVFQEGKPARLPKPPRPPEDASLRVTR